MTTDERVTALVNALQEIEKLAGQYAELCAEQSNLFCWHFGGLEGIAHRTLAAFNAAQQPAATPIWERDDCPKCGYMYEMGCVDMAAGAKDAVNLLNGDTQDVLKSTVIEAINLAIPKPAAAPKEGEQQPKMDDELLRIAERLGNYSHTRNDDVIRTFANDIVELVTERGTAIATPQPYARVRELEAMLHKYARHLIEADTICELLVHSDNKCTCGLDAALSTTHTAQKD